MKKYPVAFLLFVPLLAFDETPQTVQNLTVHEWGTFTSVAGQDGLPMDWDALGCKSDLPGFVHDFGYRGFKWRLQGTVRMETPVIYFYSPHEMQAHVKVSLPLGLITEWYPQADYQIFQKNKMGASTRVGQNLQGIDTSLRNVAGVLEWNDVKIQPDAAQSFPTESGSNHYYAARETDAAPLSAGDQREKFLFYRGVGRFPIPLSVQVSGDGKIEVANRGSDPVPRVILFENYGGRLGYRNVGALVDRASIEPPSLDASFAALRYDLEASLQAQGLYPKEARAMVDTWQDSWFEEGSRLIYIVPARSVDSILPLQIDPAPSSISRVFVGRIELVTPETRRTIQEAIAHADWPVLQKYDRFLVPIVNSIYPGNAAMAGEVEQQYRTHTATCR